MNAMIVALPGILRDGLSGWFSSMSEVKVVAITDKLESALESVGESCPSLVVLVPDGIDTEYLARVESLKALCPRTVIIALVEDPEEVQACKEGAVDAALIKGVRPEKLSEILVGLIDATAGAEAGYKREMPG